MAPAAAVMLILDTDHISELHRGVPLSDALRRRLDATAIPFGTTVVSVDELVRGRLAQIAAAKNGDKLIIPYARFQGLVEVGQQVKVQPLGDVTHLFSSDGTKALRHPPAERKA